MRKDYVYKIVPSPVGTLKLIASKDGLAAILWENDPPGRVRLDVVGEDPDYPVLNETERQLADYFAGRRKVFDLKLDFAIDHDARVAARLDADSLPGIDQQDCEVGR